MPTYEYACTSCGERLEVVQRFSDDPLTECPACSGALRKVFSPVGVVFKGSGFYKTDSRGSTKAGPDKKTPEPSTSGDSKSADSAGSSGAAASGSGSKDAGSKDAGSTGTGTASKGSKPAGGSGERVA